MNLRDNSLNNTLIKARREKHRNQTGCHLCKSHFGLFLESSTKVDEKLFAHPFCILNQQYASEYDGLEDFTWGFQVLLDPKREYQSILRVISEPEKLKHCFCNNEQPQMV
jgi:hypothetical protein